MDKKSGFRGSGMGVGYVSVMVIFVTVCLMLFAVLSLRAASSNDAFNVRSGQYLKQYYAADSEAKRILAELDEIAKFAAEGDYFAEDFEMSAGEGIEVSEADGGCSARYSVKIDSRRELLCEVVFFEKGRFDIVRWQSAAIYGDEDDSHLNVWDGTFD